MSFTINDLRKLGFCCNGIKSWFKSNRLDFDKFLKDGLDFNDIKHINCAFVRKLNLFLTETGHE